MLLTLLLTGQCVVPVRKLLRITKTVAKFYLLTSLEASDPDPMKNVRIWNR